MRTPRRAALRRTRARLGRLDRRLLARATAGRGPGVDRVMTGASTLANRSLLWGGVAGVLAATGRRQPRSAAVSGLLGIGFAATLVNGPLKFAWQRDRPPVDVAPLLPLPRTFSFPSGHSASALAFATGVTSAWPIAGPVVLPMAGTVAYSRVHTGVHYPSDVAVGATFGVVAGLVAARIVKRVRASSVHHPDAPTLDVAIPRRAMLLSSPNAGTADDLQAARAALADGGFEIVREFEIAETEALTVAVREHEGPLLVIAAGGDGTVGLAADAIADTDAVLFTLPLGTSNDVARSFGIPPDAVEAAGALSDYRVSEVDAGVVELDTGSYRFLNATTIGLNVAFAGLATKKSMRDKFGGLTYPVAAAHAVRSYVPFPCVVEMDGETRTYDVVHLSVSNAPVFGGVLGMRVPGASMTDGLLDVIIIEQLSIARLVLAVADTIVGRHKPVHRVHTARVRSIRVAPADGDRDVEIACDGEVIGTLPAGFSVRAASVRVAIPHG